MEETHKRRAHYSGKYPKKYEEKYKELNPDQYEGIAEHVKSKGATPAGTHISICVTEILQFLDIKPGQNGLDCTLGYGGHTMAMLNCLSGEGHITGLDVDPIESVKTEERIRNAGYSEDVFSRRLINFCKIDEVAAEFGPFDFVLADLGVSSMQIDNPERGFSYKVDGPLDLRLDPTSGKSAAEVLSLLTKDEFSGMLIENADEPFADEIADAVFKAMRRGTKIETTTDLRHIVEDVITALPAKRLRAVLLDDTSSDSELRSKLKKKTLARVFQALRIDVNKEYEVLYELLSKLPGVLKPGGKVAILTFHSGEDRLVKQSFKSFLRDGTYQLISEDPIRPSAQECAENPRAKSTKFRYAVRSVY